MHTREPTRPTPASAVATAMAKTTSGRPATLILTGVLVAILLAAIPARAGGPDSVLIVSIDALHPDALGGKTTPVLHRLMQQGRYTLAGQSVQPPKTLVAHTAMLTGLTPARNGKLDNDWKPGEARVSLPTLFDDARKENFLTAFYFAKPKLGYLVSAAINEHKLTPLDGIDHMRAFFRGQGRRLGFLHLSGLEYAGADSGWMSAEYFAELADIDSALAPLLAEVRARGAYAIVITSDHAGHDRQHGTNHPQDARLPLIVAANIAPLPRIPPGAWPITNLRELVRSLLRAEQAAATGAKALPDKR